MELTELKAIRRMRKIKIKELVKTTGITRNTISNIERGKANPTFDSVRKICDALGVKIIFSL